MIGTLDRLAADSLTNSAGELWGLGGSFPLAS